MLDKIKALEKLALELEPNASKRKYLQEQVIAYSERFLEQIDSLNAYNVTQSKGKGVYDAPIDRTGKSIDTLLDLLETEVDYPGLNPASGGHLAYIPGGGIYPAALGDYLADVTNRYAGVFYASPGAVRIENQLIRWLNDCFNFPETAGGNLTSGGSIANLTAIVTARESKQLKAREYEHAVIYTTAQTHHCVHKALKVAGMVEATIRKIATDSDFRMDTAALSKQIQLDRAAHLRPFMVVGSAGTTDTGAVDPLNELARYLQRTMTFGFMSMRLMVASSLWPKKPRRFSMVLSVLTVLW